LIPILNVAWQPNIIVAAPAVPAASLADVIALLRTRKLSFGTPKPVVDRFYEAVLKVMAMAEVKEHLATLGFEPADTSGEEFRRLVPDEVKKWTKVIEAANIKLE